MILVIQNSYGKKSFSFEFTVLPKENQFKSHVFIQFISKTKLCIGTPFQCKSVQFDTGTHLTFLLEKHGRGEALPITIFDKTISSTYHLRFTTGYVFTSQKIISGNQSIDKLKLGPIEIEEGDFFLADDWASEQKYSIIGLKIDLKQNTYPSFILLLYNNAIIDSKEFTIERNEDNSGTITFGRSTANLKYNKILSTQISLEPYSIGHFTQIEKICADNIDNPLDSEIISQLDESFGLIQMPYKLKDSIMEYYLKNLDCTEETYLARKKSIKSLDFYYFICPKDKVFNNKITHELFFAFKEANIALLKEDYFMEFNSTSMIFSVILKKSKGDPQYIIGEPILKHYRVNHNFEDLTFTLYSKVNARNSIFHSESTISLLIIVTSIMIGGIFFIGFLFVRKVK